MLIMFKLMLFVVDALLLGKGICHLSREKSGVLLVGQLHSSHGTTSSPSHDSESEPSKSFHHPSTSHRHY
jgi:hypothetical protein